MKQRILLAVALCAAVTLSWAGETEHYVNGVEGIKAATVPPPGIYFRSYEVFYHADTLKDKNGNDVPFNFHANVIASAERGIWVTDRLKEVIGCDFGMYFIVPVTHAHEEIKTFGIEDTRTRVGDLEFSPALFSWHKKYFDLSLAYDIFLPTGDRDNSQPATMLIGREYWTHMLTFGGTGYLDKEKTWSVSALSRYEVHSQQKGTYVKPGQDFHFEWGVGKSVGKSGWEVGLAGYCQWQTTNDRGKGATDKARDRVFAAGPEVNYFIKPIGLCAALRSEIEFGAKDRPQGTMTTLTFTKRF
ncbi:MAG TPA: transporter [Planctomycetota bacterium]|jgi:hypothetical protein